MKNHPSDKQNKPFSSSTNLFTKLRHFQPSKQSLFQEDKSSKKNDDSIITAHISKPKNSKLILKPNSCNLAFQIK